MITALIAAVALGAPARLDKTVDLIPTDDVWVYPHASDPSKDEYLRCWGSNGQAVAPSPDQSEEFSYTYMKWDLSSLPADAKVTGAQLILMHIAKPGYGLSDATAAPIEARGLGTDFDEKTWDYDMSSKLFPDKADAAVFGTGAPTAIPGDEKPFPIHIDLFKGPAKFDEYIMGANRSVERKLALAITSKMDPQASGMTYVYKFYSKDAAAANRPILRLTLSG